MTYQTESYLTPEEAARQINVHVETIRRLLRDGTIESIKIGRGPRAHWRISLNAWNKFLQAAAHNGIVQAE